MFICIFESFIGHSGPGGLAVAYLNEYSIVSAAFTLHSSEIKIIKVRFKIIVRTQIILSRHILFISPIFIFTANII